MTELEKLVRTWEKHKPTGTPHEHIWNGFIDDAKAAIEREKQALSIANVVGRSELLKALLSKMIEEFDNGEVSWETRDSAERLFKSL